MKTIALIISISFIACNQQVFVTIPLNNKYDDSLPSNQEPGKCYSKCLMSDKVLLNDVNYIEYTGTEFSNTFVKKDKLIITPATSRWVKKKADRDCLSANPDDCLVWCLEENPEEIFKYFMVTDTNQIKDFEIKTIPQKTIIEKGGFQEWCEVLCEHEINDELIAAISMKLKESGFLNTFKTKIDIEFKSGLTRYQKDFGLPIGNLNIPTLNHLNL